jgi:hypothetical protein
MQFLVSFYVFCLIAGAAARSIASRGEAERKAINSLLYTVGRSWSSSILVQSWRNFFAVNMLYIGASSLLLGSGKFGTTLMDFNPWMFFGGLMMLAFATMTQNILIREYTDDCERKNPRTKNKD